jgi:hypothetical protein
MIEIPHLEWHITHNCNLSCQGCMHFTNHGHNWFIEVDTLKQWYSYWNNRISPSSMSILGGEPLLHRDLEKIICLTREMWIQPTENSYFEIVTNGLLIDKKIHKNLPKVLKDTNCHLTLSIHSTRENKKYSEKLDNSLNILKEWKEEYGIEIHLHDMKQYWSKAYKGFGINSEPFEDNDPEESWNNCIAGQKCFQLYQGKIYKCCMTAYLQLQKDKYGNMLSEKWNPYLKYIPLDFNCTNEEIVEFFNKKSEYVCGMCPKNPKIFEKKDPLIPISDYENQIKYYYN